MWEVNQRGFAPIVNENVEFVVVAVDESVCSKAEEEVHEGGVEARYVSYCLDIIPWERK